MHNFPMPPVYFEKLHAAYLALKLFLATMQNPPPPLRAHTPRPQPIPTTEPPATLALTISSPPCDESRFHAHGWEAGGLGEEL